MKNYHLLAEDPLTQPILSKGIKDWSGLLEYVRHIPYGRNANRTDVSLVIKEHQGTCSSKHALLKTVADLNSIPATLIMGIYKMNVNNTPKIGNVLEEHDLDYIPEAHCYLRIGDQTIDVTSASSSFDRIQDAVLEEQAIIPEQVGAYKVDVHKIFIKEWIVENNISLSFEEVWNLREQCIKNLSS
ncbi:hypothetical protein [Aquimarina spongiae]|uniref:Transglutaminase-like superfamily protein n=1 Tax=Aquimarina spongiae TaxID=570521 RepID=A0A1M6A937_9FLAO|nr:hypothetical protein [Aquimarina spongiae]SHI32643.1 hypothetical protein SAMN04488508_101150 [Aquimarina spongiae]